MEINFSALSLALSIRRPLWIKVDTPVKQFICMLADEDSVVFFFLSPSFRYVKGHGEDTAQWQNTMVRKKKGIILYIYWKTQDSCKSSKTKTSNWLGRDHFFIQVLQIISLWKHCSVVVNNNIPKSTYFMGRGGGGRKSPQNSTDSWI